jgi:hypothetical protein
MKRVLVVCAALTITAAQARAEWPADFQAAFAAEAQQSAPDFSGFSAARGATFFGAAHGGTDPRAAGEHVVTGKRIEPLAPAANPERFTRSDKVEKWFKRNCNDVLGRSCTAQEKGDVLAWLMSLGG